MSYYQPLLLAVGVRGNKYARTAYYYCSSSGGA